MSMQDKEMDELFRAKLDNLEIEPSAKVWKGITVELDGAKRKRSLVPVIRIAAGITVFIAIGLFFMLKGDKLADQVARHTGLKQQGVRLSAKGEEIDENEENVIIPKQNAQQVAAKNRTPEQAKTANESGHIKNNNIKDYSLAAINKLAVANNLKHRTVKTVQPSAIEVKEIEQERSRPTEQTLAVLPEKEIKQTQAVVPDEPLNTDKPAIPGADDFKTGNKVASVPLPATKPAKAPVKKHGIRTFGDLINVVVAKVDKRQDKVIHFSDSDDDEESNITGINLGFVKVKKEEK